MRISEVLSLGLLGSGVRVVMTMLKVRCSTDVKEMLSMAGRGK